MLIAGLLLGVFVGFITACLVIAARRGLWLKVEVDQRDHSTTVLHHHYVHPQPDLNELTPQATRVTDGRALRRGLVTPPAHELISRKEIGQ